MSLELVEAVNLADMEATLTASSFAGWLPDTVPSRVVAFEDVDYRIVHGIPMAPADFSCFTDFSGEVNGYESESGFHDPHAVDTGASFRWFPEDFTTTLWEPDSVAGLREAPEPEQQLVEVRSWDDVARYETWASAAANYTWTTLYNAEVDTSHPVFSPYGDVDPVLHNDFWYWRGDRYVTNPAITLDEDSGLMMVWTPTQTISRVSLVVVVIPRTPHGEAYTLMSANDQIHVQLNDNSEIELLVPGSETSTIALTGRTRPNEPIIVGLSISMDGSRQVMMSVVDEQIRTVAVTTDPGDPDLTFDDLNWSLGFFQDSRMDLLELDLYLGVADLETMLRLSSIFDRIYGVTRR